MDIRVSLIKLHPRYWLNLYRLITAAGCIAAVILVMATPLQLPDPDDWAYYMGTKHFSDGEFTVDSYTIYRESYSIGKQGGVLLQYLPLDRDTWALEKAPGVVFYLVPFYKMGIPRASVIPAVLGMVIVTYLLLKRLRDEKAAMVGSLLMLFTPIGLVMANRIYMDTYMSLAFLAIGGGLYLYYHLGRDDYKPWQSGLLVFTAFFFTGWSVITRYTNLPIAAVLALHLAITCIVRWRRDRGAGLKTDLVSMVIGAGIPAVAILAYNHYVFGSVFNYGYAITPYPISFAFQYIGQEFEGSSVPLTILGNNSLAMARNLLIGFPLLVIGIPGFIVILCFKVFRKNGTEGKWSSLRNEMPWDILLVLAGWFICVFGLYLGYEWTAGLKNGGGFVLFNRFLLPGLFPAVIITALIIARFPNILLAAALALLLVYGILMYTQWVYSLDILPSWLAERTLEGRWPGYGFPPWTEAGQTYYQP